MYWAFGLDGLSALFFLTIALTVFLGALVARVEGRFLGLALLMEGLLLGLFAARDLLVFYVFFEAALIPALLMLYLYGGRGGRGPSTPSSSSPWWAPCPCSPPSSGPGSSRAAPPSSWRTSSPTPPGRGRLLGLPGLRPGLRHQDAPLPPPRLASPFHQENHPSGLADALGTLYKVGVFAFFRFAIPLAPEGFAQAQGLLLFLAALSALYGAWVAFAAKDFKTLLAYAGLSHMGVAALGVFSGTPEGAMGGLYLLAASGVYTGGSSSSREGFTSGRAPWRSGATGAWHKAPRASPPWPSSSSSPWWASPGFPASPGSF